MIVWRRRGRKKKQEKCSIPRDWTSNKRLRLLHYICMYLQEEIQIILSFYMNFKAYTDSLGSRWNNQESHTLTSLYILRHYSRSFGFQFKYLIVWQFLFSSFTGTLIINAFLLSGLRVFSPFPSIDPRLFLCLYVYNECRLHTFLVALIGMKNKKNKRDCRE